MVKFPWLRIWMDLKGFLLCVYCESYELVWFILDMKFRV
jgi:hypothetical protein